MSEGAAGDFMLYLCKLLTSVIIRQWLIGSICGHVTSIDLIQVMNSSAVTLLLFVYSMN